MNGSAREGEAVKDVMRTEKRIREELDRLTERLAELPADREREQVELRGSAQALMWALGMLRVTPTRCASVGVEKALASGMTDRELIDELSDSPEERA